jgi:anaerobic magnesium-protoporphyrin IX monomethyl ester cyclase
VRMQLGQKRNWTDSDDLCIMFKAAYNTEFYRAVRDALHAEVDTWASPKVLHETADQVAALWRRVDELEPVSRNADAFEFPETTSAFTSCAIVPLDQLATARGA